MTRTGKHTRLAAAALVVGVSRADASDAFPDVPDESPFHDEIAWLANTGITTGFEDGTFGPTLPVTRQAIAAYLYRYDRALGEGVCGGTQTQIPQAECDALIALYNTTNGPGWTDNTGWLTSATPCDWYGVTCTTPETPAANVVELTLRNNALEGSIPTEIGDLANLTTLDLSENWLSVTPYLYGLSGLIPAEISDLTNLRLLWLHQNDLSGPVPVEFLNLTELTILRLWNGLGNGCFTSSSPALTAMLGLLDADWDGGCP